MTRMEPGLWQACVAEWEPFAAPEYVTALLWYVRGELERVMGNRLQVPWEAPDYGPEEVITGVFAWRGFDTDAEDEGRGKPQFEILAEELPAVKLRWYKRLGRSMSVNLELTPAEWITVFNACVASVRGYGVDGVPLPVCHPAPGR